MKSKLREILRKLVVQEMSTTGSTASMSAGAGEQYATPKAFKKSKAVTTNMRKN